jgi:trimethylamine---corrinoid protein Co-methyltransferase
MTYDATPELEPIRPAYRLRILDDGQIAQLKAASLELLDEVGVHCPSARARGIYAAAGARIDRETGIVRLSPALVVEAMSHAPRHYTLGARSQGHDLVLDGTALYCATDGCCTNTMDLTTGQRRPSVKADVAAMARVADSLSSIGFYWPMVSAQDHPACAPLHELDASFRNTVKHVQTETVMGADMARYAIEMAQVVAGDAESLRDRPPLSSLICTIAPLAQDEGGMEAALAFAAAGLPVGFMSMANAGSTAPASLAGTVAVADAEIVAAMVLVQLAHPGAPVYHSLMPGIMHPRTGGYLATALEGGLLYAVGVEMAHAWGVPTLAGVFGTDATLPGWQQAAESASCLLLCALCGAEMGAGLGLLEGCTLLYPEAIILDSDIYQRVRFDVAGLDTSREALALDVVKKVGPRGHFLLEHHTRTQLRRRRFSDLVAQPSPDGYRDPLHVAREKVEDILAGHYPQPLDDAQLAELDRILDAAEGELS